jgi:hypothetical protein
MDNDEQKKCRWCRHFFDCDDVTAVCERYSREPGSDDDKGVDVERE